jgi:hypothetical protein
MVHWLVTRVIVRWSFACLVLWGLGSCSSPFSPAAHVAGCPDGTSVQISGGTTPGFSWGACRVAVVRVEPVDAQGAPIGNPVWGVLGEDDASGVTNNVIESGVTYGQQPKFATTQVGQHRCSGGNATGFPSASPDLLRPSGRR